MANRPAVILVHGLWMNRYACAPLAMMLRRAGFDTHLFGYSSLGNSIAINAKSLAYFRDRLSADTVHLIGHSLGGLVILRMLAEHSPAHPGRVLLLGSPVRGSQVARSLIGRPGGKLLLGASLPHWQDEPLSEWRGTTEVGMIAGSVRLGIAMFFSGHLPKPNDGAVAVEETRLPGLKAHITLPVSHTGMLLSSQVAKEAAAFLRTGDFLHALDTLD